MFVRNELGEYEAKIDKLTFVCEEVQDGYEELAAQLAKVYKSRLEAIGKFLIDEGIEEVFGELQPARLIRALGRPLIDLSNESITYADNSLDDYSIISFEYTGLFEEFSYLCIDG